METEGTLPAKGKAKSGEETASVTELKGGASGAPTGGAYKPSAKTPAPSLGPGNAASSPPSPSPAPSPPPATKQSAVAASPVLADQETAPKGEPSGKKGKSAGGGQTPAKAPAPSPSPPAKDQPKAEKKKKAAEMSDSSKTGGSPGDAGGAAAPQKAQESKGTDAGAAGEAQADPYKAAVDAFNAGSYDEAIQKLGAIIQTPKSSATGLAPVYHLLAKAWKHEGNSGKALIYYENLFARFPAYGSIDQARWEAALLYVETGDAKAARGLLEKLLASPAWKDKARKKLDTLK